MPASDRNSNARAAEPRHDVASAKLRSLHADMALLRAVDEAMGELSQAGACGAHLAFSGTEAVLAGTAAALEPRDWVLPGARQASLALLRGASLDSWFGQVLGRSTDPARGRQEPGHASFRSLHVVSPSTRPGNQLAIAVGVGRAMKMAARGEVAVALAGHACVGRDIFHVGLNFAAVWRAPVVFVVIVGSDLAEHTASDGVAVKARAYGMPANEIDGGDVLAVEAAVRDAIAHAREDKGPSLLAVTCPSPGSPVVPARGGLRLVGDASELETWHERDPIARAERELVSRELTDEVAAMEMRLEQHARVRRAADAALQQPPPTPSLLFDDVFAQLTPALRAQRAEWIVDRDIEI